MVLFFTLDDAVHGITFGGGYYWLLDLDNQKVIAYNTDGTRASTNDFDLDSDNSAPSGITYYNDKLWVIDSPASKVYVYNTDGTRSSGNDFDFSLLNAIITGITYHDNKFWIVDETDIKYMPLIQMEPYHQQMILI